MLEVDIQNEELKDSHQALSAPKQASRASKSWISAEPDVDENIFDVEAGMNLVRCTTRIATSVGVTTAVLMIPLYAITQAAVVRTAALDAVGDCVSGFMALYTSYRMQHWEPKRYPVGQAKFQSIGCLIFSTFMFAVMFGNALGNIEGLIEGPQDIAFSAISRFFHQTGEDLGGDFAIWHRSVVPTNSGYVWSNDGVELRNPLKAYFLKNGDVREKELALSMKDPTTRKDIVREVSEYENYTDTRNALWQQNIFLLCFAFPRALIWLYCISYAIPRTGSAVLQAVATDKMTDVIGTLAIVATTSVSFMFPEWLPIEEAKIDPLVSLFLSIYFMYCWYDSIGEHAHYLSQEVASAEICDEVKSDVRTAIAGSRCSVADEDIKVYSSSEKYTVEVTLVASGTAYFLDVSRTIRKVEGRLRRKRHLERVLIFSRSASSPENGV